MGITRNTPAAEQVGSCSFYPRKIPILESSSGISARIQGRIGPRLGAESDNRERRDLLWWGCYQEVCGGNSVTEHRRGFSPE